MGAILVVSFETLSFLVALFGFIKCKLPLYLRFFPFYLFITVAFEIIAYNLWDREPKTNHLYNIFGNFEFVFYAFVLYHVLSSKRIKAIVLYSMLTYTLITLPYNCTVFDKRFHTMAYIPGTALIVCYCFFYFYELFRVPVNKNPVHDPAFWICCGLLIFYSCTMPIMLLVRYYTPEFGLNVFQLIFSVTNCFLYSCFAVAVISFLRLKKSGEIK
jgi:hypothetical protein